MQQSNSSSLAPFRAPSPMAVLQSQSYLVAPPSVSDFNLPLKPFRIPFLHTKDARSAVVLADEKFKRPSTASSMRSMESGSPTSRTLGIRTQVGESRADTVPPMQSGPGRLARPSTALSATNSVGTRPKSAGTNSQLTSRNRSLTHVELDRIEVERRRLDDRLISLKGTLNEMNAQSKFMDDDLKRLQFQSTILDKDLLECDADAEHRLVQSLQAVQTKTEYWIQSVKEEELYTNTLSLVFDRNSKARSDVETKTSIVQSELAHYDHDMHVLSIRLHQAKLEQTAAEKAFQSFSDEIEAWRSSRDAQLSARSKIVADIRAQSAVPKILEDGSSVVNSDVSEADSSSNVIDMMSKRSLQEGMLQMKRLTQQESAVSIAASYNYCIERTQMFLEEQENVKQRIIECNNQKQTLSKTLELLKYGGDESDSHADIRIKAQTAKVAKKCAEFTSILSNAEIQFTSLKNGLQNLQNRIQCVPAVDNALPFEHESEAARIMASIGNISCLGLYEDVVSECVQMVRSCGSKIVRIHSTTQALMRTATIQTDGKDIMSKYQKELYDVDATARPNNIRVVMESASVRRQKFYQDQLESQQHIDAEAESMRDLRTSLKQSAVSATRKSVPKSEMTSALTPTAAATRRNSTVA